MSVSRFSYHKFRRLHRCLSACALVIAALAGSAFSQTQMEPGPMPASTPIAVQADPSYRLGPADIIRVTVLKQDLLTQDGVRIGNDGRVRLAMLDEPIQAACLTADELAQTIAIKYRRFILNPQVYVTIREFNSNSVAVIGAVNSPGRFQLQRPVRLLEIMALVNGPSPKAGEEIVILRTTDGPSCEDGALSGSVGVSANEVPEVLALHVNDVLAGSPSANPVLRGGDIVRIAEAELRQAFVMGNVKSAATINLKDPVTLSTAIAMAGGPSSGAQLEKVKISRQTPGSLSKKDLFVNLKEIRNGEKEDVLLEPNDIVDVPGPSGTKKLFKDIIRTIVPVFTRVPVIVP